MFDPLLTLVFLARDDLLDQLRIFLLLRHHRIIDDLLLMMKFLLENLRSRTVRRGLEILLGLLGLLLRLVRLNLIVEVRVEVGLLDLREIGH